MSRDRVVGLALVTVGIILLTVLQLDLAPTLVPALIGAGFLGVYALTRRYEFLVPGGLLTGFGSGFVIEVELEVPGATLFGLGTGFLFVALLDRLATGGRVGGWWPLLPGATLTAVGVIQFAEALDVLVAAADWWPLLLVGAGLAVILRPGPVVERDEPDGHRSGDSAARP
ncbi:hypothetical protein ER308_16245 [Egibacter rhizosphaerae]|uniref:DUF5668 domain-containing protein n=1 Tax=Egibacter rhizosphaerae TaxID=1670831 RepID=A0A411YIJ7_9ACTN|nr:hypothetical protein [Egibacter rhizosphaerae]QBI20971.1 hypothetical protein ER308_16245 [Egibacter rhizosphaerae]